MYKLNIDNIRTIYISRFYRAQSNTFLHSIAVYYAVGHEFNIVSRVPSYLSITREKAIYAAAYVAISSAIGHTLGPIKILSTSRQLCRFLSYNTRYTGSNEVLRGLRGISSRTTVVPVLLDNTFEGKNPNYSSNLHYNLSKVCI